MNVSLGEALKDATENYFLKLVQDDGNDSDDSETHANVRLEQAARMGKATDLVGVVFAERSRDPRTQFAGDSVRTGQ